MGIRFGRVRYGRQQCDLRTPAQGSRGSGVQYGSGEHGELHTCDTVLLCSPLHQHHGPVL